jgi:hypothetical protein
MVGDIYLVRVAPLRERERELGSKRATSTIPFVAYRQQIQNTAITVLARVPH